MTIVAAEWATSLQSMRLLRLCCRIAADMVASGDVVKVADPESCGFLSAIISAFPDDDQVASIVEAFLAHLNVYMSDGPAAVEWTLWTYFIQANERLFGPEKLNEWANRAESFCAEEVKLILMDTRNSSEAQDWFDEVVSVAKSWGISLEAEKRSVSEHCNELARSEEGPDREDFWRSPSSADRLTGDNAAIDKLFESLRNIANRSD